MDLSKKLQDVYLSVQQVTTFHRKQAVYLQQIFDECDFNDFYDEFHNIICAFLLELDVKNPHLQKAFEFTALFLSILQKKHCETDDETVHPLLDNLVTFLCEDVVDVNVPNLSLNCVNLIAEILKELVDFDLPTDFCNLIQNALLDRLHDSRLDIRTITIETINKFQDASDENDPIIKKFINLINYNKSAKIRCLCIQKIAMTHPVINILIQKLRDVHEDVRLAAFKRLQALPVKVFTITQRRAILHCAMHEFSKRNIDYIDNEFVQNWFSKYKYDFHKMLSGIRLDMTDGAIQETNNLCEFVINTLLKKEPLNSFIKAVGVSGIDKLIPIDSLNWETANFWRIVVEHLVKMNVQEMDILPELVFFCQYIERFCASVEEDNQESPEFYFILQQLFKILSTYDLSENFGRNTYFHLIRKMPTDIHLNAETAKYLTICLEKIEPSLEKRAQFVNELISELSTSTVTTSKEDNGLMSPDLFEEIQYNMDESILIRCCNLASGFLLASKLKRTTLSVELMKSSIFENIKDGELPFEVVYCFGLFCLLDQNDAIMGFPNLAQQILIYIDGGDCEIRTLIFSIEIVTDLIMKFGTEFITTALNNNENFNLEKIIRGFIELMDDELVEVREISTRCLCILVLENIIISSNILTNMVLKYCRPIVEENNDLTRNMIGFTLNQLSYAVPTFHEYWENAIIMTLSHLCEQRNNFGNVCVVSIKDLTKYMLKLYHSNLQDGGASKARFALKILKKINKNPKATVVPILSDVLIMLELQVKNEINEVLTETCDEIRDRVRDAKSTRNIIKFIANLNKIEE